MRLRWLCPSLTALALGALVSRTARAQPEVLSTAVLGLETLDVPSSLADDISEQLRQRVSGSKDLHLVSGKDLVEVKLVFSCADEAATCMAQAGKSLDAQRVIYGSVKKQGEDIAIWLKMFDVRKGKVEFWLTETLTKKQIDPGGIKAASVRWFAKLTGKPLNAGTVQVTSSVFGAKVSLDGNPVGVTSEQPLAIPDVAAGKHELTLSKPGQAPAKQQFMVAAGQTATVNLTLGPAGAATAKVPNEASDAKPVETAKVAPAAVPAVDPEKAGPASLGKNEAAGGHGGYRSGFWVTLLAGLASAGAAVKFGLDVQDVNDKLDPLRRFPCMGGKVCNSKGAEVSGRTADEDKRVASLNDEGARAQTLQWICVGVGSALGITSGYLFYKGYLDSDGDNARHEAHRGLRIFPTAGASTGGILAEFDF
jgi:TolB-like protein